MTATFTARIDGPLIHIEIVSNSALRDVIFCFSLMAAAAVVSGGTLVKSVAGYSEIALPDIAPDTPVHLVIRHDNPDFRPVNRAWLPLGAYLRVAGKAITLPPLAVGVLPANDCPAPVVQGLRLIPQPSDWQPAAGTLSLSRISTDDPAFARADTLAIRQNLPPLTGAGTPLTLIATADLPPEAYGLTITPESIQVRASGEAGRFYAAITLLTLRETHAGRIPCGTLTDVPRFVWRGQHLDCARHFYDLPTILRLLDLMALVKLNQIGRAHV